MRKALSEYKKIIGVDIETTDGNGKGSLDPFTGKIALVQIAHSNKNIELLRLNKDTYRYIKDLLEDPEVLKIGHNFKFDMKFFVKENIYPTEIFDTMIASEIYYTGSGVDFVSEVVEATKKDAERADEALFEEHLSTMRKRTKGTKFYHNLQAVLKRELNIFISKEMRTSDWSKELTPAQQEYAKSDVRYLEQLAFALWKKIKDRKLENIFFLETQLMEVLVFMELTGVKISREIWEKRLKETERKMLELEKELKLEIYKTYFSQNNQSGLFAELEEEQAQNINLNSALQMKKIFGFENVSKLGIEKEKDNPIIQKFLLYKQLMKEVSTYSEGYLGRLNQYGRLTSDYSQTRTATGRISSSNPNLQNIPGWFKYTISAEPKRIPVFIDYSQVELRILAYLSQDESFIESTNSEDLHAANARKVFNIPEGVAVPKDLRKKAKTVSFAIPYGTSALGLVQRGFFDTLEEAQQAINSFYETFPKVKAFLDENAKSASELGYTRDALGRIRIYEIPTKPSEYDQYYEEYKLVYNLVREKEGKNIRDFLDYPTYKEFLEKSNSELTRVITEDKFKAFKKIINYRMSISAIRREGQNHPIQATSASITKTALVRLFDYLTKTNRGVITLSVHDSIFFELNEEDIVSTIKVIKNIMEEAGKEIINGPTPVDVEVGKKVELLCKKCGQTYTDNQYYLDLESEKIVDKLTQDTYNYCENCK
ncbi:MAG: DNA polymerase [Thermoproteota archaeon]